ncbi:uncharacterized protein LOC117330131 [Pecten maximus]|uniref:uncharacterized protein LOC117330131 n=1 Tax=Pecten maximus TaxID=6579 RepID=UPI001458E51F|nr:uncharacterized protein LOC117330131 [Pecten maximus]XP_033744249.1 uncharacterized protein LOC117330131 [Pecten maximus]
MDRDNKTQLIKVLDEMGLAPKCKDPEEFKEWMSSYLQEQGGSADVKPRTESKEHHIVTQQARLPPFSGDPSAKQEPSYDLWRYEVECLCRDSTITEEMLAQIIHRSLRGNAGLVAMRLGSGAAISELLTQLDSNYGVVEDQEALMGKFYNASQGDSEDVTSWGCRLEDLLVKATRTEPLSMTKRNHMLHSRIWKGLRSALKERSAAKFELCPGYEDFKVELRKMESEMAIEQKSTIKTATSKMACSDTCNEDPRYEKLEGMIKQLTAEVRNMKSRDGEVKKSGFGNHLIVHGHRPLYWLGRKTARCGCASTSGR